jgi:conjugal transfer pilus assembly protein TraL
MEKFVIPKHLDDPTRFLLWSVDEAMSFMVPVFFGVMLGHGIIGLILSIFSYKFWKKVKGNGAGRSIIKGLLYWYYPKSVSGLNATPDSSNRNYIA